jgi:Thioredoxin
MSKPHSTPLRPERGALARWRPRAVAAITLLAVFGGAAAIGHAVKENKRGEVKKPTGATGAGGYSIAGAGAPIPVTVTLYEDLRSKASHDFVQKFTPTLKQMVATGQVKVEYRFVTSSDGKYGGTGSADAANAAACAQDVGKFAEYMDVLWAAQPAEKDDAFGDEAHLIALAKKVHGIDRATFNPCVRDAKHHGWVRSAQRDFAKDKLGQAPVLTVNNLTVNPEKVDLTPDRLTDIVHQAVKDAGAGW